VLCTGYCNQGTQRSHSTRRINVYDGKPEGSVIYIVAVYVIIVIIVMIVIIVLCKCPCTAFGTRARSINNFQLESGH
jgi:hypothetical protein